MLLSNVSQSDVDVAVRQSVSSTATAEHVVSGSEMLLSNVSQSDAGTYLCTARNSHGSTSARVTVIVTGRPLALSPSSCLCVVS